MRNTSAASAQPDRLIPRREGYRLLGISPSTGWRKEKEDPTFPKPVALNTAANVHNIRYAFRLSELLRYMDNMPRRDARACVGTIPQREVA